jgi:hypothetical protein
MGVNGGAGLDPFTVAGTVCDGLAAGEEIE